MIKSFIHEEPLIKRKRKPIRGNNEDPPAQQYSKDDGTNAVVKNEYQKVRKKHVPKFRFKPTGDSASLLTPAKERIPLTLTDLQYLLLHSLLGNINLNQSPRWYVLDKCNHISQTTCIIFEGISVEHWEKYNQNMHYMGKMFTQCVEILTPSVYNGSLVKELALVPLSQSEKESIIQKYGSINLALEARKDLMVMMRAVFPIEGIISEEDYYSLEDTYPRTQLLLSAWQLIEENYPLPLKGKLEHAYADYKMTKDTYKPVTPKSPMFGLDCEMCLTSAGSELTRVSIVNEKHQCVYETFVKPYNNITDYLTRYSGVTKSSLMDIKKRLEDVQRDIQDLLPPDAILVGQSLQTDLHALKMMHPYIIDTSVIFNLTGERANKPKLKVLAKMYLNEDIQGNGSNGHCPTEDSMASLKLVQLKLKKNMEFGDAVHIKRKDYKENLKVIQKKEYATSIFNHIIEQKKTSIVVGCDNITGDYYTYLTQAKESLNVHLKNGKLKKIKLCTLDDADEVICKLSEGVTEYNLAMAHLKMETDSGNELQQMKNIDGWIQKVWDRMKDSGLIVIIFGGTTENNGLAMLKIKNI